MTISALYTLDKVVYPSGNEITQISDQRWGTDIQLLVTRPAGHWAPMFVANQMAKPFVEFKTPQIDIVLDELGFVGNAGTSALYTYLKHKSKTGTVARATTTHKRIAINSWYSYFTQIQLPHNGLGEATVRICAVYDGTNAPFVFAGTQALSGNLSAGDHFGCGPFKINGTTFAGAQNITIDSGITLTEQGDASELYPTWVGMEQIQPSVTVSAVGLTNWATVVLDGLALNGSTGVVVYARKYAANGTRVAAATEEHVAITGLLGLATAIDTSGQGNSPTQDQMRFDLIASTDTGVPLTVDTTAAIS